MVLDADPRIRDVYHDETTCHIGNNIEPENVAQPEQRKQHKGRAFVGPLAVEVQKRQRTLCFGDSPVPCRLFHAAP